MVGTLTLALTADLHWGHRRGDEATLLLRDFLLAHPPEVLVLAGDIGTGPNFDACLTLFDGLTCRKALVPGNHDVWVPKDYPQDSLHWYEHELPDAAARHGFHYLDHGPLYLPDVDLAVVGTMNWYDYSWSLEEIRRLFPGEEHRLRSKQFTRGKHNDVNFVRWALDDVSFTARVVAAFERQLTEALGRAGRVLVVAHHPPFRAISFPAAPAGPPELDRLLWDAFGGNQALEDLLARHADRITHAFCGHTHRAREGKLGPIAGYNIGGDYHFKRLLRLDWPGGAVEAHEFGRTEG